MLNEKEKADAWKSLVIDLGTTVVAGVKYADNVIEAGIKYADDIIDVAEGAGSNNVLSNKTFTNSTGKVNNYTSSTKGMEAARADFDALNPTNVRTAPNGTILGDLPNGTTINIHPGTSVGGSPTLEIPDPTTGMSTKIRY